jgi:succinyl-CoA synthetase alpha subunit
MEAIEA